MIQPEIKVVEDTKEIKSDLVFVGPEIKANEAVEPYEMIELPPEDPISTQYHRITHSKV